MARRHRVGAMMAIVLSVLLVAGMASAAVVVLDFEGLQNLEPINNYYNGGTGGFGSGPGPNYGIVFSSDSLAIIDADAGGTGNFANEPSANTIAFFLTGAGDTMNVAAGFDTGFSFYYTSIDAPGSVTVWDGLNGTGTELAHLDLAALGSAGNGDPNGAFDTWAAIGVTFSGTAQSVIFAGAADRIGFDDITLGSDVPGPQGVPEPSTLLLLGSGLVGLVGYRRTKRIA